MRTQVSLSDLLEQRFPTFGAQGSGFAQTIFPRTGVQRGGGSGLGIVQAHYIYRAPYFHCYYISFTSDHQASDSEVGDP